MNTYEFQSLVLEAARRMLAAQTWAANEQFLKQVGVILPSIASITQIAQCVATVIGRFRKVDATTRIALVKQAEAQMGPLII